VIPVVVCVWGVGVGGKYVLRVKLLRFLLGCDGLSECLSAEEL
jgi:hypothetical protein